MRFSLLTIIACSIFLVATTGCQNATLQCRRETALLRAEIIDLEDKYYALKSEYESAVGGDSRIVSDGVIGSGIIQGAQVVGSPVMIDGYPVVSGDVIYEGEYVQGSTVDGGTVYYPEQQLPTVEQPSTMSPIIGDPGVIPGATIPAPIREPESFKLQLEAEPSGNSTPTSSNEQPRGGDQASMQSELPELEIGFESGDARVEKVDRLEIVSEGTRGKDLDGYAGDEGVELMFHAVDVNGNFVEANGEVTVTIMDDQLGQIGKWTFLPKELRLFLSRDEFGNTGTLLHLPWTNQIPASNVVEIRVSMMIGGIEYIATRRLKIDPPSNSPTQDAVVGWTANDRRWISGAKPKLRGNTAGTQSKPSRSKTVSRPQWKPVR